MPPVSVTRKEVDCRTTNRYPSANGQLLLGPSCTSTRRQHGSVSPYPTHLPQAGQYLNRGWQGTGLRRVRSGRPSQCGIFHPIFSCMIPIFTSMHYGGMKTIGSRGLSCVEIPLGPCRGWYSARSSCSYAVCMERAQLEGRPKFEMKNNSSKARTSWEYQPLKDRTRDTCAMYRKCPFQRPPFSGLTMILLTVHGPWQQAP